MNENTLQNYAPSFSERVFLNNTFLNVFCPPNCEDNRITQVTNSIIVTLLYSPTDLFANAQKGYLHWTTKPFRAAFRAAAIGLVTLTVSPLGSLYFGSLTLKNYWNYTKEKEFTYERNVKWVETERIGRAFLTDLICSTVGAVSFYVGRLLTLSIIDISKGLYFNTPVRMRNSILFSKLDKISTGALLVLFGAASIGGLLGAYYPSYTLSRMLKQMYKDQETPLFLALEVRNQLGIVDQQSGLLKFSEADRLEYGTDYMHGVTTPSFRGPAYRAQISLIVHAEMEMLDLAVAANALLKKRKLPPLKASYPFNGKTIAKTLQDAFKTKKQDQSIVIYDENNSFASTQKLIQDLKKLEFKINILKELFHSCLHLAVKEPLLLELVSVFGGPSRREVDIPKLKCFLEKKSYLDYFRTAIPMGADNPEQNQSADIYKEIEPLAPSAAQPNAEDLYQNFLYRLRVNKGNLNRQEDLTYSDKGLLGLEEDCSFADKKITYRKYLMALHPDKNPNRFQQANALFGIFQSIQKRIDAS